MKPSLEAFLFVISTLQSFSRSHVKNVQHIKSEQVLPYFFFRFIVSPPSPPRFDTGFLIFVFSQNKKILPFNHIMEERRKNVLAVVAKTVYPLQQSNERRWQRWQEENPISYSPSFQYSTSSLGYLYSDSSE